MYNFIPVCSSVISCSNKTESAVQMPAYQGRLHMKYTVPGIHSWDTNFQKVAHFLPFFHVCENAIKCQLVTLNLAHTGKCILILNLVQIQAKSADSANYKNQFY